MQCVKHFKVYALMIFNICIHQTLGAQILGVLLRLQSATKRNLIFLSPAL